MIFEGVRPDNDNLTFTVALKECLRLFDLKTVEKLWCKAMDCGFEFDVFVGSSVLNFYAKYQKMDEAIVVFDSMLGRDLVCWTTTISGFAKSGLPIKAFDMYKCKRRQWTEMGL
ncbi:hypothetical protein CMV_024437 [Castanea mollissima]|uniref:Pentatricopeptide repeat-containing protein n=1 Tax=Castanea mollissima TaxID=60419 RepID=A0A8J4QGY1_9ROSI|nr:hypothetical protein CMV_024437 [Castanea mollissima]